MNDRIGMIRELIVNKEGKYHPYSDPKNPILPLEPGQNVWLQDSNFRQWEEAVFQEKCREPNFYIVETPSGSVFRRNSNFIKPRPSASDQKLQSIQYLLLQNKVVLPPVQWMPFPQYPQHCRTGILP